MPKFAANLTMMFNEVPFPQRFAAAAKAGFAAVEFLFPYDYPPAEVARWLQEAGLKNALFNMPPGDWAAGERGVASLPGREEEFRDGVALCHPIRRGARHAPHPCHGRPLALRRRPQAPPRGVRRQPATCRQGPGRGRTGARCSSNRSTAATFPAISSTHRPKRMPSAGSGGAESQGADGLLPRRKSSKATSPSPSGSTSPTSATSRSPRCPIATNRTKARSITGYLFRLLDELAYPGWVGCEYRPSGKHRGWPRAG